MNALVNDVIPCCWLYKYHHFENTAVTLLFPEDGRNWSLRNADVPLLNHVASHSVRSKSLYVELWISQISLLVLYCTMHAVLSKLMWIK